MKRDISIIVAMTPNYVIGCDGKIPWNIPEDMRFFRETTTGSGNNALIMGRSTYESIGKPLGKRLNIVVSNSMAECPEKYPGLIIKNSLHDALEYSGQNAQATFIIGGRRIFEQGLSFASRMYITLVNQDYNGDVYFPRFNGREWDIEPLIHKDNFDILEYTRKI